MQLLCAAHMAPGRMNSVRELTAATSVKCNLSTQLIGICYNLLLNILVADVYIIFFLQHLPGVEQLAGVHGRTYHDAILV